MLRLDVSVVYTRVFVCAWGVCLRESIYCTCACPSKRDFVLHLDVSVFQSLCCTSECLSTRALCSIWSVCPQEHVLHLCVSINNSFVLYLDVSAYKSLAHAVPVVAHCIVYIKIFFGLFRLFRHVFETPKQTDKFIFWFHETPKNNRKN